MEIYIPSGESEDAALSKITHIAISAHEDDIEFMAYDGILRCRRDDSLSFGAVVLTDGAGSPRAGRYASCTDAEMIGIRRLEQMEAARIGGYGALAMLGFPSAKIKDPADTDAVDKLADILMRARPRVVYTHNPADRHETHLAACLRTVAALRRVCRDGWRPEHFYGCEVWRDLDWLPDEYKISFDVGGSPELEAELLRAFDSQIAGGKGYDLAVIGRRRAHATFGASHRVDDTDRVIYAVDMMPLLDDPSLPAADFICGIIDEFGRGVRRAVEAIETRGQANI